MYFLKSLGGIGGLLSGSVKNVSPFLYLFFYIFAEPVPEMCELTLWHHTKQL